MASATAWKRGAATLVAQKSVSNMLNPEGPTPNLEIVEAVAQAFNITGWLLIHPQFDPTMKNGDSVNQLVLNFLSAGPEGRENINRVANMEARYKLAGKS